MWEDRGTYAVEYEHDLVAVSGVHVHEGIVSFVLTSDTMIVFRVVSSAVEYC